MYYPLWATKVTTEPLNRAMSTLVVQEHHLCLNLAKMWDAEKVRFLDAPIVHGGLIYPPLLGMQIPHSNSIGFF